MHPSIFGVRIKARRVSVPQHGYPSLDCWPGRLTVMSSLQSDVRRLGSTLPLNRRLLVLVQYQTTTKSFGDIAFHASSTATIEQKPLFVRAVSVYRTPQRMKRQQRKTRHFLSPLGPSWMQKSKPVLSNHRTGGRAHRDRAEHLFSTAAMHPPGIMNRGLELRRSGSWT